MRKTSIAFVCVLALIAGSKDLFGQISDEQVRNSLNAGVRFLASKQEADGSWPDVDYSNFPSGVTSLCTLALLNAGRKPDDPTVRRALNYLRSQTETKETYTVALQTIVLCTAEPKKDMFQIRRNVAWLQRAQHNKNDEKKGSWGYNSGDITEDPSNAQFALLALYEAERVGVPVKESTWRLALDYWKGIQRKNGSFAYGGGQPSSGSMTCAGIGSMIISSGQIGKLDASATDKGVICCGAGVEEDETHEAIEKALKWLGGHFSVKRNPSSRQADGFPGMYHYYYMYALERTGRLAGRRFIGEHDWYREGAEELIQLQDKLSGYWNKKDQLVSTAFSVLFLSKGRRPILMSKVKRLPEDDWNRHSHDVAHLTKYVEGRWKQDMTWQVVDIAAASLEDLMQSPVLFISGRDALDIARAEKDSLREYIEAGNFVFAENCCDGQGFDRDFRALMKELFPDTELKLLPPDHPVWFAEQRVDSRFMRPLEGLDACCRTGVVYCPETPKRKALSCFWELAKPERGDKQKLPPIVREEMEACLAIGANVLTYATGRELKQKLDATGLVSVVKATETLDRGSLYIAKLRHSGGSDDAPSALTNILNYVGKQTQLPVSEQKRLVSLVEPTLPDYPIAFMHGRRSFRWSQAERKAFRRYVENGGVIFADAICANQDFTESLRKELKSIFPNYRLSRIPPDHPMFSPAYEGHDLQTVTLRDPRKQARRDDPLSVRTEQIAPFLEGIEIDGRFVFIFSPYDMSCALENRPSLECKGYTSQDAAKLATNVILYALQQ